MVLHAELRDSEPHIFSIMELGLAPISDLLHALQGFTSLKAEDDPDGWPRDFGNGPSTAPSE